MSAISVDAVETDTSQVLSALLKVDRSKDSRRRRKRRGTDLSFFFRVSFFTVKVPLLVTPS
jgi:hypothetical protein